MEGTNCFVKMLGSRGIGLFMLLTLTKAECVQL